MRWIFFQHAYHYNILFYHQILSFLLHSELEYCTQVKLTLRNTPQYDDMDILIAVSMFRVTCCFINPSKGFIKSCAQLRAGVFLNVHNHTIFNAKFEGVHMPTFTFLSQFEEMPLCCFDFAAAVRVPIHTEEAIAVGFDRPKCYAKRFRKVVINIPHLLSAAMHCGDKA